MGSLVNYKIRYYDAMTLSMIRTATVSSSIGGNLKLWEFPNLTLENPIILYTIDRQDYEGLEVADSAPLLEEDLSRAINLEELNELLEIQQKENYQSAVTSHFQWKVLKIVNSLGQDVLPLREHCDPIMLTWLPLGLYFIVVTNGHEIKTLKLINRYG
jgi:hypothetical protein